ncbi:hypothetical protein HRR88_001620 [Exophiala dermatitidis]|nr:hypothetical protein HRR84_003963 [Exophiala dermatitidis]KAJ4632072.1 hypothetical protein HRR88_001620 [Exophiala dermatitidis]KAJ4681789.1 hypothetical protein HRR92_002506 [Exophiala dermatitidis]KAJ9002805.1 hypothetical protein HRR94_002313 [Exophiala dermatitidis]
MEVDVNVPPGKAVDRPSVVLKSRACCGWKAVCHHPGIAPSCLLHPVRQPRACRECLRWRNGGVVVRPGRMPLHWLVRDPILIHSSPMMWRLVLDVLQGAGIIDMLSTRGRRHQRVLLNEEIASTIPVRLGLRSD